MSVLRKKLDAGLGYRETRTKGVNAKTPKREDAKRKGRKGMQRSGI
jgi:hypothetical protein